MFSLQRRNAVIKGLAGRTDNISAAQWSEAIRIIAEQIEEELFESKRTTSETLEMLNASLATARKRRERRESAPQSVEGLPDSDAGCGATIEDVRP